MTAITKAHHPQLRLSEKEIDNIKTSVSSLDPDAAVYLFGSRIDLAKRGGDIDLLIVSTLIDQRELYKIRWHFFEQFGEQKMDIILDDGTGQTPFARMILPRAVLL